MIEYRLYNRNSIKNDYGEYSTLVDRMFGMQGLNYKSLFSTDELKTGLNSYLFGISRANKGKGLLIHIITNLSFYLGYCFIVGVYEDRDQLYETKIKVKELIDPQFIDMLKEELNWVNYNLKDLLDNGESEEEDNE